MAQKPLAEAFDEFVATLPTEESSAAIMAVLQVTLLQAFVAGMDYGVDRTYSIITGESDGQ